MEGMASGAVPRESAIWASKSHLRSHNAATGCKQLAPQAVLTTGRSCCRPAALCGNPSAISAVKALCRWAALQAPEDKRQLAARPPGGARLAHSRPTASGASEMASHAVSIQLF